MIPAAKHLEDVRRFYDQWSAQFLAGFGSTFQAGLLKDGREGPEDPDVSTRLLAERAGVLSGQRVLDVGCGVGGPAICMASVFDVTVAGVTVSAVQTALGRRLIADAGLEERISIVQADYHDLPFATDSFDTSVLFESIGYSGDRNGLLAEVARVVRPGGRLYVKDVFALPEPLSEVQRRDLQAFDRLWHLAKSPTIPEVSEALEQAGCDVLTSGPLEDAGNARFLRAMIDLDPDTIFRLNALGRAFSLDADDLPTFFGEVVGVVRQ